MESGEIVSTVLSYVWQALAVVLVFGLVIFIHEFGHFITAKKCGVKVNEFAIGMGPRLLKFGKGETTYSLRVFPIGGYVSMEGEDEESQDPRSFQRAKVWKRMLITAAGAIMNFLLGFIVIIFLLLSLELVPTKVVAEFTEDAVSNKGVSPLMVGDEIVSVNGRRCFVINDVFYELGRVHGTNAEIVVKRNGKIVELPAVQFEIEESTDQGDIMKQDFYIYGEDKNVWNVLKETGNQTMFYARAVFTSLLDLVTGRIPLHALSGPVAVAQVIAEQATIGLPNLLSLLALFTINLGVFNLLPIPGLDGGHLLFLLIEAVRGKPIKQKYEGIIHMIGLAFLVGLVLLVTFWDITKMF